MRVHRLEDDSVSPEVILENLADEDARALIRSMDRPRNAGELAERSDVPVSTTYRKLERLESATLIDEQIDIRDDGRHTSQYRPYFEQVVITLTEDRELDIELVRPTETTDERLAHLWSEVRKGVQ